MTRSSRTQGLRCVSGRLWLSFGWESYFLQLTHSWGSSWGLGGGREVYLALCMVGYSTIHHLFLYYSMKKATPGYRPKLHTRGLSEWWFPGCVDGSPAGPDLCWGKKMERKTGSDFGQPLIGQIKVTSPTLGQWVLWDLLRLLLLDQMVDDFHGLMILWALLRMIE